MSLSMPFVIAGAMLLAACAPDSEADNVGSVPANQVSAAPDSGPDASAGTPIANDFQAPAPAVAGQDESGSLLESSVPSDGARVTASPENLVLNFRQPLRLAEVTVTSADGQTMPIMVTAVGLVRSYSIPISGLEPGSYRVQWRALDAAGVSREGSFGFTVG